MARSTGKMTVLMVITYKGYNLYIRLFGKNMYVWDVIFNNELYSSYIVIRPSIGKKTLTAKEREEVIKMCYSGASATIDSLLGIDLTETDKAVVSRFESARKTVEESH